MFKKNRAIEYRAICRWIGEDETFVVFGGSAGLASLDADPMIEILSVERMN